MKVSEFLKNYNRNVYEYQVLYYVRGLEVFYISDSLYGIQQTAKYSDLGYQQVFTMRRDMIFKQRYFSGGFGGIFMKVYEFLKNYQKNYAEFLYTFLDRIPARPKKFFAIFI